MEKAVMIDWRKEICDEISSDRVYFGHETCEHILPCPQKACELAKMFADKGMEVTLITPFLTNKGFDNTCRLIDSLLGICSNPEVVCSDWGMLHYLCKNGICRPVIGRPLLAQHVDPRIKRMVKSKAQYGNTRQVMHVDGTSCLLKYKPPSSLLVGHLQQSWADKPSVISFFSKLNVRRCEISNIVQGLELAKHAGWSYSLHVPEVLVGIMRFCPGTGENFNLARVCDCKAHIQDKVVWHYPGFPTNLFRKENALYYSQHTMPKDLNSLPIDRIVHNQAWQGKF
ncbi:hypothetical protein QUF72_14125 [Desulfobacterales bacterium HSG2]|nr:hypothetical protein [Desulfobacterales bacterium HSG2]